MKTIIHPLAAILLAWSAGASETWSTSPAEAMQQAAAQNKGVMLEFTGSDWCPPCMQLRANVFSKPDFQKEAQKNFVLVELDYPRGKEQSKEMKAANEKLAQQYGKGIEQRLQNIGKFRPPRKNS